MRTHHDCTFITYKEKSKKGKFRQANVTIPVYLFGKSAPPVLILHWIVLIGNPSNPSDPILLEETTEDIGQNSKTMYINDSFNLDTILLDIDEIVDTDDAIDTD
jgi:hypothetical protein